MKKTIHVRDALQKGYRYKLTAPIGRGFDPAFSPELTPKRMLTLGIFGGAYFEGEIAEYPPDWFVRAKNYVRPDAKNNFFKVHASQSREMWKRKGWIHHDDPRGWFQWYCRYYLGRRMPDEDARQIKRWRMMRRHIAQLAKNCMVGDFTCRPVQRQALLHWAYDSRKI